MTYLTGMADILRSAGLPVREIDGWRTRGHGTMSTPLGVLVHHTAGPASGAYPSERVVVAGHSDLPGPLANLGLDRDGVWIIVAAGKAYHAGAGSMSWVPAGQGNARLIGVEAESVGTRDDWTAAQRTNYPRGVAALLKAFGLPAERAIGHKEWAPTRKIDPAFWDMNAFRADVRRWLTDTPAPAPTPAPPSPSSTLLRRGSKGAKVSELQRVLNAWYPRLRLAVDGDYGPATERAVRDMQRRAGITADGIAGPVTLGRLGIAS